MAKDQKRTENQVGDYLTRHEEELMLKLKDEIDMMIPFLSSRYWLHRKT